MSSNASDRRKMLIASATAGLALPAFGAEPPKGGPVRVVYHVTEGDAQARRCMNNVRNHLVADPTAKIVVVGNGAGIDFMLDGAKDSSGAEYAGNIGDFAGRGVSFRVCGNTLQSRGISKDKVLLDASVVPSGVAEAANLQFREGYAYISP